MEKVAIIDSAQYSEISRQIQQICENTNYIRTNLQATQKPLYTNKDLIELLGVNVKTLKKYRDEGYLGYSKIGDKIFYTPADVEQFLTMTHRDAFA